MTADRPQACAEWREDVAAWAVAQGSPEREAAFVAHMEGCADCRAEAEGLLAIAAVTLAADPDLASAMTVEPALEPDHRLPPVPGPPVDLADRISRRIRRERRSTCVRRSLVVAVGAAAAAVLVLGALALRPDGSLSPVRGQRFTFVDALPGAHGAAVVGKDDGAGSVVQLTASGLDPTTTYALWLTPPGGTYADRVPAGTFRPRPDGRVDVRLHSGLPVDKVGRVWATTPERQIALDTA